MTDFVYKDPDITITRDFLHFPHGERETIQINSISEIIASRTETGDYKAGAVLFFIIGIATVWFVIGFLFLVLGIAAWNTRIYSYHLKIRVGENIMEILSSKSRGHVKSIASTIRGLAFSQKIHTFAST